MGRRFPSVLAVLTIPLFACPGSRADSEERVTHEFEVKLVRRDGIRTDQEVARGLPEGSPGLHVEVTSDQPIACWEGADEPVAIEPGTTAEYEVENDEILSCQSRAEAEVVAAKVVYWVHRGSVSWDEIDSRQKKLVEAAAALTNENIDEDTERFLIHALALGQEGEEVVSAKQKPAVIAELPEGSYLRIHSPSGEIAVNEWQLKAKNVITPAGQPIGVYNWGPKKGQPIPDATKVSQEYGKYALLCTDGANPPYVLYGGSDSSHLHRSVSGKLTCGLNTKGGTAFMVGHFYVKVARIDVIGAKAKIAAMLEGNESARVARESELNGARLAQLEQAASIVEAENLLTWNEYQIDVALKEKAREDALAAEQKAREDAEAERARKAGVVDSVFGEVRTLPYEAVIKYVRVTLEPAKNVVEDPVDGPTEYLDYRLGGSAFFERNTGGTKKTFEVAFPSQLTGNTIGTSTPWSEGPAEKVTLDVCAGSIEKLVETGKQLAEVKPRVTAYTVRSFLGDLATKNPAACAPTTVHTVRLQRAENSFRFCYAKTRVRHETERKVHLLVGYRPVSVSALFTGDFMGTPVRVTRVRNEFPEGLPFAAKKYVSRVSWENEGAYPEKVCVEADDIEAAPARADVLEKAGITEQRRDEEPKPDEAPAATTESASGP